VLVTVLVAGCQTQGDGNPAFDNARNQLIRGEYQQAATHFEQFLAEQPDHHLASRASFLLAKSHVGLDDLGAAAVQFEETRRRYPDSEEAHKSRYKLAVISLLRGEREAAIEQFRAIAETPDGVLAPEASAMVRFLEVAEERQN
jgi:TolA-binding protein